MFVLDGDQLWSKMPLLPTNSRLSSSKASWSKRSQSRSTSLSHRRTAKVRVCSICGQSGCVHKGGKRYDGRLCFFTLSRPTDAYEWSFVAVPAQRRAAVSSRKVAHTWPTPSKQTFIKAPPF